MVLVAGIHVELQKLRKSDTRKTPKKGLEEPLLDKVTDSTEAALALLNVRKAWAAESGPKSPLPADDKLKQWCDVA